MKRNIKKYVFSVLLLIAVSTWCQATALVPNDTTISDDLVLWLRDPINNYDAGLGIWYDLSSHAADANEVGISPNNAIDYIAPTVSGKSSGNVIAHNTSIAYFAPDVDDLIETKKGLNGGEGLTDLTIFTVYIVDSAEVSGSAGESNIRPAGIGSAAAEGSTSTFLNGDKFDLALDPSIRKDNGNIGSGNYSQEHPDYGTMMIRVSRMDSSTGVVTEWFNSAGTLDRVLDSSDSAAFTTGTDVFYLGDVRAGVTTVRNTTVEADLGIAEVAVYKSALTDTQIAGVAEWLSENVGLSLNPVVTVTETDDSTTVSEWTPNISDSFTVELTSAPTAPVTVTVSPGTSDPNFADYRPNSKEIMLNGEAAGTSVSFVFDDSNWDQPQTIEVKAVDDEDAERSHMTVLSVTASSSDADFDGGGGMVVPVTIVDNDAADIQIVETDGSTLIAEGGVSGASITDTFDVVLNYEPSAEVVISLPVDANNLTVSPEVLTFDDTNFDVAQTVTVTAVDDDVIDEESETVTITFEITSDDTEFESLTVEQTVTILDNECGAAGYSEMDYNEDCLVDIQDFAEFALQYLSCTYPNDPDCD